MNTKIRKTDQISAVCAECRRQNKKIILCHGVFDLVHPGHLRHFEEAKSLGDVLVVSVTAARFVRKGPGRPYFGDEQRMEFLAALQYVDYVVLSESDTACDVIPLVKPDIYVKGREYKKAEDDITGKISEECELVERYGGSVYYTSGEVFSSTRLINRAFPVFSNEMRAYLSDFSREHSMKEIRGISEKMEKIKVLVVGDIIVDEYVFCRIQGLMSKNMGYSAKYIKDEKYLGGSLAVARHLADLSRDVTIMSVMGKEEGLKRQIERECGNIRLKLIQSEDCHTIVKKRFVEPDDRRDELNKIFVINNLPDPMTIDPNPMESFKRTLTEEIDKYDVVFLCDFGHGLVDQGVMEIVQSMAKKLVLNCQTNSSNYGMNLITKYHRADYFVLNEKELRLAYADYKLPQEDILEKLSSQLDCSGWLTRGSKGSVSICGGN